MKKTLALIMALVMIFTLCACNVKTTKTESVTENGVTTTTTTTNNNGQVETTTTTTGEKGKLVVGFDSEFPPYGFIAPDGSYDGFDLAVAKEVCNRLGWDFEAVPIDWNAKDAELKANTINCIWNGFTCTGRENEYTWSDPYVDNSIVVVVKKDSGIKSLADLKGKVLMAQAGSSGADAVAAAEGLKDSLGNYVELPDYNAGFMELSQGTVDAIAADTGVAAYQMASKQGEYVMLDEPLSTEQYAVGFLLGNTELRDKVNEKLLEIAKDGTMMKIAQDYVDEGLVLEGLCLCK